MPTFTQDAIAIGQDGFVSSAVQMQPLGQKGISKDGRVFRYCKAGLVDLVAGNSIQSPAINALHLALTPVAAPVGATVITATLGASAAALNQYAEGYLQVSDGGAAVGQGNQYAVSGHAAVLSGGVITINLKADDAVQVALTTASRVGLVANPYNGVIVTPQTTATGIVVGFATYIISAGQFGWLQTGGMACATVNGTPALGAAVIGVSATTAGSLDIAVAATLITGQIVGYMAQLGVSTKSNAVFLKIN